MLIAVNGTLMRGQPANPILLAAGACFMREARTAPVYRLWSIQDRHPGMLRIAPGEVGGTAIALELWEIEPAQAIRVLEQEPPGLSLGWVQLEDGVQVLGVLAEAYLLAGCAEITRYGGWREYQEQR